MQLKNWKKLAEHMEPYKDMVLGFEPFIWLHVDGNVALQKDDDIALFERQALLPNAVYGHYFFTSRGAGAKESAVELLKEAFTGPYDIDCIIGMTPLDNKGALWMNKYLGFKEQGELDTPAGPCKLVMLTKQEWEISNG